MLEIVISSFLNTISLIGSGGFLFLFFRNLKISNSEKFLLLITLGILTSATFAVLINFFFPIDNLISNSYILLVFCVGIFLIKKFKEINFLLIILFACIFSSLLLYKSENVVDFPVYHSPFISILEIEKIIFGLANIHFRFGHTSVVQNVMALYNVSIFKPNNFQTIIPIFFSSFFIYYLFLVIDVKKFRDNNIIYLFNFFIFSYICIKYYRFNDFGNDLISNLIVFYIWSKFLKIYYEIKDKNYNYNNDTVILILLYTICLFNKYSAVFNFIPILIIFLHLNKKEFFKKNVKLLLILTTILSVFVIKNIINTGCILYPVSFSCFEKLSWTTDYKDNLSNPKKRSLESEAWSKDWPNRYDKNIKNTEYIKNFNWLPTWSDHHLKKIIKKLSIYYFYLFLILFVIFNSFNKFFYFKFNLKKIIFILFASIPVIFWFIKFPIYRYSSSNIIILINLLILYFISDKINLLKLNKFFKFNSYFLILLVILLNFKKIYTNHSHKNWPNIAQPESLVLKKLDFENITINYAINNVCYYSKNICTHFKIPENIKINRKSGYIFIENKIND